MNFCQVFDMKISQRDIGADPIEDLAFVIDVEHELVNVETRPPTEKSSSQADLVMVCCNQCGHPVMIRHSDNVLYCEKCGPIMVARTETSTSYQTSFYVFFLRLCYQSFLKTYNVKLTICI